MERMGALLLLFIVVPLVEIWLLLRAGAAIGAVPTLALVIITGVLGAGLARWQSATVQARMRGDHQGEPPTQAILEGLLIFVAGVVLITPGILTDILGFALLIPPSRRWFVERARERIAAGGGGGVQFFTFGAPPSGGAPGAPPTAGGVRDLSPDDYDVRDVETEPERENDASRLDG